MEKHYRKSMENLLRKKKKKNNDLNDDQKCRYVVHEMLNPLSVINNCTELMLHKLNDIGKDYDSGHGSSDNDSNSSTESLTEADRDQMVILLSMIKNQISKCTEVSRCIMTDNCDNSAINVNNMMLEYINSFKSCNPTANISMNSNISNNYHFRSNNCKAYLKIIFDNMLNNVLKYNNSVYINLDRNKDGYIEILIGDNDKGTKIGNANPINEKKKSNFIGLEIIEKFCSILGIQWNLIQNEQGKYIYKLLFNL